MTQEDKELLLKDLCSRLPYGVKLLHIPSGEKTVLEMMNCDAIDGDIHDLINNFQPYLRPMSSMTEEECIELDNIETTIENIYEMIPNAPYYIEVVSSKQIDWLNAHHFDYRGLIEKGLAIEITKENNPYEN